MNLQAWKVFNGTPWYYLLLPVPLESMNWLYMLVVNEFSLLMNTFSNIEHGWKGILADFQLFISTFVWDFIFKLEISGHNCLAQVKPPAL